MLRISHLTIWGLREQESAPVKVGLRPSPEITFLHGPCGSGKSLVLRLLQHLSDVKRMPDGFYHPFPSLGAHFRFSVDTFEGPSAHAATGPLWVLRAKEGEDWAPDPGAKKFRESLQPVVQVRRDLPLSLLSSADPAYDLPFLPGRAWGKRGHRLSNGESAWIGLFQQVLAAPEGSLVLIDEPEASLHVSLQEAMAPNLLRIGAARNLRFVLATHSPYIVGDHGDWMVALPNPYGNPANPRGSSE